MTSSSRGSLVLLLVELWILKQIRDSQLPCFLGQKVPVREDSGPICSLGGGVWGVINCLWCGVGGLLLQAQKFRDIWGVPVFRGLPPILPGSYVRGAGFPEDL